MPTLLEDMRFIGFDLTNLGNNSYAINGLPAGVENLDPVSLIRNMVDRVIDTGCEVHEEICDSLALSLAKAAAIRPGKILSGEEMDNLLASLFSCQESAATHLPPPSLSRPPRRDLPDQSESNPRDAPVRTVSSCATGPPWASLPERPSAPGPPAPPRAA